MGIYLYIFHVPALGEQIIDFAKIGIINNLGNSTLAYPHHLRDLLLGPAKAVQSDDSEILTPIGPPVNILNTYRSSSVGPSFFLQLSYLRYWDS